MRRKHPIKDKLKLKDFLYKKENIKLSASRPMRNIYFFVWLVCFSLLMILALIMVFPDTTLALLDNIIKLF